MAQSQFSLSWDSFKSNICSGFSALQQSGEFVDMTLAADGHLVKAHQVLIALASPYLKEMIASAPCPHPVIYLNNVSHKVLCYLLEYIYTGEATVPSDCLAEFGEAAHSLHIKGLENIHSSNDYIQNSSGLPASTPKSMGTVDSNIFTHSAKRKAPPLQTYDQQVALPSGARKIFIKAEGPIEVKHIESADDTHDYADAMDDTANDSDDGYKPDQPNLSMDLEKLKATASNLLFTVSIRGSLQVILNRYIYNLNSTTSRTGLRKWRCVEYRNKKCAAFVVTKGNVVVNRANVHSHSFHDKKILAKIEKKAVFSALDEVEAYKEKEKEIDQASQITVDEETLEEYKDDMN